ncbi:MAG TPA: histidine phosphatase family protein [Micromonosporaceae bacterium]|nr:histidine phosphatase family protein [Micromonosporaceae bacterium]
MATRTLYLARHGEATPDGRLTDSGRRQARLLGERLAGVPFAGVHHSPVPRAVQTAALIGESLPAVPAAPDEALGEYVPPVPDPTELPEVFANFLASFTAEELAEGAKLAVEALDRYARPAVTATRELVVTHNFVVAWFVRHALDAPDWRWLGLNLSNCALTVIAYRDDRPPTVVAVNDMAHLPPPLRWTGFPPDQHV